MFNNLFSKIVLSDNVKKKFRARRGADDNMAHAPFAEYLRLQTHTQNMYYSLPFHCNNGCTNAPQCYVIRTLAVLLRL